MCACGCVSECVCGGGSGRMCACGCVSECVYVSLTQPPLHLVTPANLVNELPLEGTDLWVQLKGV